MDPRPDRDLLNAIAADQFAVLSRDQLVSRGVSDDFIRWRVASKRWVQLHRGVYLTSPGRRDWYVTAQAGLLYVGPDAVLSHRSAGYTFGLVPAPQVIEILIPHGRKVRAPDGIVVRRCRDLRARTDDWLGISRTTLEHTVLDIAAESDADAAIAIVATACRKQLTGDVWLLRALEGRPRHRWGTLLRDALVDVGGGAESILEVRYIRDVERPHGLPLGVSQLASQGGRRRHDRGYPDHRVIVELDGAEFHSGTAAVQRDGRRRRGSASEGWVTVPGYWSDVAVHPCAFALELGEVFVARGWTGRVTACRRPGCLARRALG